MPKKLTNALTPIAVKSARPGRHADGSGLHLLVKQGGARSWVYRFMLRGKSRDLGLGPATGADAVSLASRHRLGMDRADRLVRFARQERHERPALARTP